MVGNCRTQAQHVSVLCNFGNDGLAFTRSRGQLCLPGAEDKSPTSLLAFKKQHRGAGIDCGGRDGIQSLHEGWGKIAEKMLLPHGASRAVVEDVETVGRLHGRCSSA